MPSLRVVSGQSNRQYTNDLPAGKQARIEWIQPGCWWSHRKRQG